MGTHSLTIELTDSAYQALRDKVDSGMYGTVSDVVEDALLDLNLPPDSDSSLDEREAIAAYDEHSADPDDVYTSEQVLAYLEEQRTLFLVKSD